MTTSKEADEKEPGSSTRAARAMRAMMRGAVAQEAESWLSRLWPAAGPKVSTDSATALLQAWWHWDRDGRLWTQRADERRKMAAVALVRGWLAR